MSTFFDSLCALAGQKNMRPREVLLSQTPINSNTCSFILRSNWAKRNCWPEIRHRCYGSAELFGRYWTLQIRFGRIRRFDVPLIMRVTCDRQSLTSWAILKALNTLNLLTIHSIVKRDVVTHFFCDGTKAWNHIGSLVHTNMCTLVQIRFVLFKNCFLVLMVS